MHSQITAFRNGPKIWKDCQTKIKMDSALQKRASVRSAQNQTIAKRKNQGKRIVGLKARIEAGNIHRLHTHQNEYVLVYSLKGKCLVTVGKTAKIISPDTMIFIPPKVPHRFYNKFSIPWEEIALAIGTESKINNIWMEDNKKGK